MPKKNEKRSHRASMLFPMQLWWWLCDRATQVGHSGASGLIRAICISYMNEVTGSAPEVGCECVCCSKRALATVRSYTSTKGIER